MLEAHCNCRPRWLTRSCWHNWSPRNYRLTRAPAVCCCSEFPTSPPRISPSPTSAPLPNRNQTADIIIVIITYFIIWPSVDMFPREIKNWDIQHYYYYVLLRHNGSKAEQYRSIHTLTRNTSTKTHQKIKTVKRNRTDRLGHCFRSVYIYACTAVLLTFLGE